MTLPHYQDIKSVDWNTPQYILDAVRQVFDGSIDLDPCSNATSIVNASGEYNLELRGENGLELGWSGNVFVNPPFGRGLDKWVQKAIDSASGKDGEETSVIMLLPVAVSTKLWQNKILKRADAICFLNKRIRFVGAKNSAPMDCSLILYSNYDEKVIQKFDFNMLPMGVVI
jgi:hypothetical protein